MNRSITIAFLLTWAVSGVLRGQSGDETAGFIDRNHDGVNDLFRDADGDGVNDLTNVAYRHSFSFEDKNGDGVNDIWTDADGDGVNDRLGTAMAEESRMVDTDGDGIPDQARSGLRGKRLFAYVLDEDGDGRNDITGIAYAGSDLFGYRYGNVDEEKGITARQFSDSNGDGINDGFLDAQRSMQLRRQGIDIFIDADGDGIADDRSLRMMRGRGAQRGRK
ncbi:hypothetical protein JXO52_05660 [bacterium]|nr:hypothetical protein [bacterium]